MESTDNLHTLFAVLFPDIIRDHFEVAALEERKDCIVIRLNELPELVPVELSSKEEISLDGFCNPLELQSFPLKGKAVYLKLYRRRWKEKGTTIHYSNNYDIHPPGVKATYDFASFLKESYGQSPEQYNSDCQKFMR